MENESKKDEPNPLRDIFRNTFRGLREKNKRAAALQHDFKANRSKSGLSVEVQAELLHSIHYRAQEITAIINFYHVLKGKLALWVYPTNAWAHNRYFDALCVEFAMAWGNINPEYRVVAQKFLQESKMFMFPPHLRGTVDL